MPPLTTPPIPDRTDGETIDETWFDVLKEVAEDHEGRLQEVEFVAKTIEFHINGYVDNMVQPNIQFMLWRSPDALDLLNVKAVVETAGTSGSFQPTVQISTDGGATWDDVCSTDPIVAFGAGDYADDDGVIDAGFDQLTEGDFLRLNITQAQNGQIGGKVVVTYQETALPTPP